MQSNLFLICITCMFILGNFSGVFLYLKFKDYQEKKNNAIDRKLARQKRARARAGYIH